MNSNIFVSLLVVISALALMQASARADESGTRRPAVNPSFAEVLSLAMARVVPASQQGMIFLDGFETAIALPGDAVLAVSAGGNHTCLVTMTGVAKCQGANSHGQLGIGANLTFYSDSFHTVLDLGLGSGVQAVSAGDHHSCALTRAGGVKCWGENGAGQLGNGTTTDSDVPVDVTGLQSGIRSLALGRSRSCALTLAGGLKCWGLNGNGALGNGSVTSSSVPTDVVGLSSGVTAISVGPGLHSCALTGLGQVLCWGKNSDGQLGDGSAGNFRTTPTPIAGQHQNIVSVSAGSDHTCAVTSSGDTMCWGLNDKGQLGDGTFVSRSEPTRIIGPNLSAEGVAADGSTSCALTSVRQVWCWGRLTLEPLGAGASSPVLISALGNDIESVGLGGAQKCFITTGWKLFCGGELAPGADYPPIEVRLNSIEALALGSRHSCVLTTAGAVRCWGDNSDGQLGDATTTPRLLPVTPVGLNEGIIGITAGYSHTCALTRASSAMCWGSNAQGQLGDGSATRRLTATAVLGAGNDLVDLSASRGHTCAVSMTGALSCWGDNTSGALGDGTTNARLVPGAVSGMETGVRSVSTGDFHTCALRASGQGLCWGSNAVGQLGIGSTGGFHTTPVPVAGWVGSTSTLVAGKGYSCGINAARSALCWGNNSQGQLGDGSMTNRSLPTLVTEVSGPVIRLALSSDGEHTCSTMSYLSVRCWGVNDIGQVTGAGSGAASMVAGGARHGCSAFASALQCWGDNAFGQLGDGTTTSRMDAVQVNWR